MTVVISMEEDAQVLLNKIVSLDKISIYDLAEQWAKSRKSTSKDTFDEVIRLVYKLAASGLVQISVFQGEDGSETVIEPTNLGKTYVKSSIAAKALR